MDIFVLIIVFCSSRYHYKFIYLQNLTTRFLQYNLWANERITSWLMTLDRKKLYEHIGSSFGTIDHTLQHILSAQLYWYPIISIEQINTFNQLYKENAVDEVIADLGTSSQVLIGELTKFNDLQLLERISVSDSTQSRYEYILHLINHGSYHRGQAVVGRIWTKHRKARCSG